MTTTTEVLVACHRDALEVELLLNDLGLHYQLVSSGTDALAYLREKTPDLIILDAYLEEVTGTSIAYRVKKVKRLNKVPIMLLVDASDSKRRAEADISGVEQVVLKPFRVAPVRNIVKHLLQTESKIPASFVNAKRDFSRHN